MNIGAEGWLEKTLFLILRDGQPILMFTSGIKCNDDVRLPQLLRTHKNSSVTFKFLAMFLTLTFSTPSPRNYVYTHTFFGTFYVDVQKVCTIVTVFATQFFLPPNHRQDWM